MSSLSLSDYVCISVGQRMEIRPQYGLGNLKLGDTISSIISAIPVDQKSSEFSILQHDPLTACFHFEIPKLALRLLFEPVTQRLVVIEMLDLMCLNSNYDGKILSCQMSEKPDFKMVYALFGPTKPGKIEKEARLYVLNYPGCAILFDIPPGLDLEQPKIIERNLGSFLVNRIVLFKGNSFEESIRVVQDVEADISVEIGKGIKIEKSGMWLTFDDFVQDV
jgi:hypothetical protein